MDTLSAILIGIALFAFLGYYIWVSVGIYRAKAGRTKVCHYSNINDCSISELENMCGSTDLDDKTIDICNDFCSQSETPCAHAFCSRIIKSCSVCDDAWDSLCRNSVSFPYYCYNGYCNSHCYSSYTCLSTACNGVSHACSNLDISFTDKVTHVGSVNLISPGGKYLSFNIPSGEHPPSAFLKDTFVAPLNMSDMPSSPWVVVKNTSHEVAIIPFVAYSHSINSDGQLRAGTAYDWIFVNIEQSDDTIDEAIADEIDEAIADEIDEAIVDEIDEAIVDVVANKDILKYNDDSFSKLEPEEKEVIVQEKLIKACRIRKRRNIEMTQTFPVIYIRHSKNKNTWLTPEGIVETVTPSITHGWNISTEQLERSTFLKPNLRSTDYELIFNKKLKVGVSNDTQYILSDDPNDYTMQTDHRTVIEHSVGEWAWLTCLLHHNDKTYGAVNHSDECEVPLVSTDFFHLAVDIWNNGKITLYNTTDMYMAMCGNRLGWSAINSPIQFSIQKA